MIEPASPVEISRRATACATKNAARTLSRKTRSKSSTSTSVNGAGRLVPALLTRISNGAVLASSPKVVSIVFDDPVRVGDTAHIEPVVLGQDGATYVLQPADGTAEGSTFDATNPRPVAPAEVGGDLKIADFNVLNYFVTFGGQSRGAANADELGEQQTKIVNALKTLDADIITLHEIENSAVLTPDTPYRAVETLIAAIEATDHHDWEYVPAHYHRAFRLSEDVAADKIEAELKNGVLTVRLPKAEAAKPRRINVRVE